MAAESKLEKEVVKYATKMGVLSLKFTSPAQKGVPDRVFLHNGRALFLELKAPGKKPTVLQLRMIQKLRDRGVPCWWADNLFNAKALIYTFMAHPDSVNALYPAL